MNISQYLAKITQVSSLYSERADRTTTLSGVLQGLLDLTQGDRATVFLTSEASPQELYSFLATGLSGGSSIKVPASEGIAGHVFRSGTALLVNNARTDGRFNKKIDEQTGYQTESILAAPIKSFSGAKLGVIEVLNSKRGSFGQDDMLTLQLFSFFASVALDGSASGTSGKVLPFAPRVATAEKPSNFDLRSAKEDFELRFIDLALRETNGNKSQAAKLLGITREGLRKAMLKGKPAVAADAKQAA